VLSGIAAEDTPSGERAQRRPSADGFLAGHREGELVDEER